MVDFPASYVRKNRRVPQLLFQGSSPSDFWPVHPQPTRGYYYDLQDLDQSPPEVERISVPNGTETLVTWICWVEVGFFWKILGEENLGERDVLCWVFWLIAVGWVKHVQGWVSWNVRYSLQQQAAWSHHGWIAKGAFMGRKWPNEDQ